MTKHRIYSVSVASVYPYYVAKAEKKGRTKAEVDEVICWLTGITGVICGVPRRGHPRTHHARNPIPGQTD